MRFEYYSIKDFDIDRQTYFSKMIHSFLFRLNFEYPNFTKWYLSLYDSENLLNKEREILLCTIDGNIAGVLILKNTEVEKKICTLRVSPIYQGLGIGRTLIEKSFEFFNDDKPLITIHISKYHEFKKLFKRYNFSLEQQAQGYYGLLRSELSYNGLLSNKILKKPTFFEQVAFGIEKSIYNYPSFNSGIFISNPAKHHDSLFFIDNTTTKTLQFNI